MKKSEPSIIKEFRPKGLRGKIDRYLGKTASDLRRLILNVQDDFEYDTVCLEGEEASHLAAICVEFAEDIHCRLGLWKALEHWNRGIFQTPLPFLIEPNSKEEDSLESFDSRRVQHLIWRMIQFLRAQSEQNLVINPNHKDLKTLADAISQFLKDQFATMPIDSSIGQLLQSEHCEGCDAKRKLVWLGSSSYLFRYFCEEYLSANQPRNPKDASANVKNAER